MVALTPASSSNERARWDDDVTELLLDYLSIPGNYDQWRNAGKKTKKGATKQTPEQWKSKIKGLEKTYGQTVDDMAQMGEGLTSIKEKMGVDNIRAWVLQTCKHFERLDVIRGDRVCNKLLFLGGTGQPAGEMANDILISCRDCEEAESDTKTVPDPPRVLTVDVDEHENEGASGGEGGDDGEEGDVNEEGRVSEDTKANNEPNPAAAKDSKASEEAPQAAKRAKKTSLAETLALIQQQRMVAYEQKAALLEKKLD
ncbi:hypothetical protein HK102_008311, partial [Quaeritorhiza haematococci]